MRYTKMYPLPTDVLAGLILYENFVWKLREEKLSQRNGESDLPGLKFIQKTTQTMIVRSLHIKRNSLLNRICQ